MNFQRILTHKVAPTRDPLTNIQAKAWFRRFIAAANNAAVYGFPLVTNFKMQAC